MARAAKRSVRRAHEQKVERQYAYPDGLTLMLSIGNGVNINSPNGRDLNTAGASLLILDADGAMLASFNRDLVAGIIKMSPAAVTTGE